MRRVVKEGPDLKIHQPHIWEWRARNNASWYVCTTQSDVTSKTLGIVPEWRRLQNVRAIGVVIAINCVFCARACITSVTTTCRCRSRFFFGIMRLHFVTLPFFCNQYYAFVLKKEVACYHTEALILELLASPIGSNFAQHPHIKNHFSVKPFFVVHWLGLSKLDSEDLESSDSRTSHLSSSRTSAALSNVELPSHVSRERLNKRRHTQRIGTRFYSSPEQARGGNYCQKTDIYSLGIILMEMLSVFGYVLLVFLSTFRFCVMLTSNVLGRLTLMKWTEMFQVRIWP